MCDERDVVVLRDENADAEVDLYPGVKSTFPSRANMIHEMKLLVADARAGDCFYFHCQSI